jgi:hypothetical protein
MLGILPFNTMSIQMPTELSSSRYGAHYPGRGKESQLNMNLPGGLNLTMYNSDKQPAACLTSQYSLQVNSAYKKLKILS